MSDFHGIEPHDFFAGMALCGILGKNYIPDDDIVKLAYNYADRILKLKAERQEMSCTQHLWDNTLENLL